MRKLSNVVERVMIPIISNKNVGITKFKIFFYWDNIVGKEISDIATPYKLNYDDGLKSWILCLEIKNGAFSLMLQHLTSVIIERISVFFGYKVVSEIKIKQCF